MMLDTFLQKVKATLFGKGSEESNAMTLDTAKYYHTLIKQTADKDDCEAAHFAEDCLHTAFIKLVAKTGPSELATIAKEILKVYEMRFSRWYARPDGGN